MQAFDLNVLEIANRLGLVYPVSVCSKLDDSTVTVGYAIKSRPPKISVAIQFGAMVALLTKSEFDSLVAHEFGHILAGHTSRLGFRILHSLPRFFSEPRKTMIINLIVRAIRYRTLCLGKRQEFEADRVACTIAPAASMGRVLVKGEAFDQGIGELTYYGKIGTDPVLDREAEIEETLYFENLSPLEKTRIVFKTFEANRGAFTTCSQRAKKRDRPLVAYPSVSERLECLGLDWDSTQDSCVFDSEELIDFEAFCAWSTDRLRLIAVPFGKTLRAAETTES